PRPPSNPSPKPCHFREQDTAVPGTTSIDQRYARVTATRTAAALVVHVDVNVVGVYAAIVGARSIPALVPGLGSGKGICRTCKRDLRRHERKRGEHENWQEDPMVPTSGNASKDGHWPPTFRGSCASRRARRPRGSSPRKSLQSIRSNA